MYQRGVYHMQHSLVLSQMPYPAYYPQMLIPQPYSLTLDLTQIPYLQTLIPSRMTYSQDPCRFP